MVQEESNDYKYNVNNEPTALDLYSFWITVFFVIWLLCNKFLPYWMNPYITIYIGTLVQLLLFYFGRKFVPFWLYVEIAIWKWVMFLIAYIYFDHHYDLKTVNFNLFLLLLYLCVLYVRKRHVFGVYIDYILHENRYINNINPLEFNKDRLKQLFLIDYKN